MASCNSCGYYVPDGAKKCAACGEDLRPRVKYFWKSISLISTIFTLIVAVAVIIQSCDLHQQTEILKKQFEIDHMPNIKIGATSLIATYYQASAEDRSVALRFIIPIENNSKATAYDMKILKKELALVRETYNSAETPSLKSTLTARDFDIPAGQTKYDSIFIDESTSNFEKVQSGEAVFSLEYKIQYNTLREIRKEPFIYSYKILYTKGQFQYNQVFEKTLGR